MSLQTPVARTKEKPPEQMLKEPAARRDYLLAFLAACGMLAPALYIVTWIVAGLLYPGYNQLTQSTSELTSKAAPPAAAAVANFGGYALGLLVIAFAFGLYRGVRPSRWLLIGAILVGLFGLICVIQPFFPMDPGAGSHAFQNMMHGAVFVISGVALILWPAGPLCGVRQRSQLTALSLVHAYDTLLDVTRRSTHCCGNLSCGSARTPGKSGNTHLVRGRGIPFAEACLPSRTRARCRITRPLREFIRVLFL